MTVLDLPGDILVLILHHLSFKELSALCLTCKTFNSLVNNIGWTNYRRSNPRPSHSLCKSRQLWAPRLHVRYDTLTASSWQARRFVARPLSAPWPVKLQPAMTISNSRLVIAAGTDVYSYKFGISTRGDTPSVKLEGRCSLGDSRNSKRDITSVVFVDDGGLDRTVICGFRDGTISKIVLSAKPNTEALVPKIFQFSQEDDIVESLSSDRSFLLSLSASGQVKLTDISTFHTTSSLDLGKRSWTSHLCLEASTPYIALGTSSTTPLSVHTVREDEMSTSPTAVLGRTRKDHPMSAVYGLSRAPLSAPWGSSPQIIVSGWFDGRVRCYDLRSPLREAGPTCSEVPTALRPVLSLSDPWSDDPIYSVSCGGGTSSHIAAGSARHSVVSFWDVRYATQSGWSVYAPGNDRSPVYTVILESSRLFGATESRPFVYDFGPGVTVDTYPRISTEGLRQRKSNPASFYVTKYSHLPSNDH